MLPEIGLGFAGLIVGFFLAWAFRHTRENDQLRRASQLEQQLAERAAALETAQSERETARQRILSLETEKARIEERLIAEKSAFDQAKSSLSDTFSALARRALAENSDSFLSLAKQELGKQQLSASSNLEAKEKAIASLLQPVGEALVKLQSATQQLEVKREGAYGAVLAEINKIQEAHAKLGRETTQLVQALRAPKTRGNWGQLQLERCIEFAGMVEHASFDLEVHVRADDAALRPDCVIYLPNGRTVIVDAKTPLDAFLDAADEPDEAVRALRLAAHASAVRVHVKQLSEKKYWKQFKESPDFVVCFLPAEALFSAALEQDPELIEFGSNSSVILATPTTLIALLKAVAYGWQQMEITKNAIAIREAGEKLYDKLATAQDYVSKMGKALTSAVSHYNSLVGCIEGGKGAFAQARRLHELGVGQDELPELRRLESELRDMREDEWPQAGGLALAAEAENEAKTI
jgi:DNA recombination protein RmuC